ncbi:hypothetical protein GOP47_0017626 [Adiantum capillus-veneris]|uniref:glucan endo-1,3-beta-D-glucosidase n=1 Tax=Adiantum capillus-veneris TaxID=13818 RepID=A0A9D4UGK9_ADICA|nr:hypothetical protein GOP47_0017626 [Adiantum capillus-veneris]
MVVCTCFFSLSLLLFLAPALVQGGSIGFCYGRHGDNLPSVQSVAQLLVKESISKLRLYDYDATVISAFAGTDISLIVTIPNEELPNFQTEQQADNWVNSVVLPASQTTKIDLITVGVEVVTLTPQFSQQVLPAMMNIHTGLTKANLASQIKVSTANSMGVLETSFPPSSGAFNNSIAASYMLPILDYLKAIGSFYMVNAYPYHAYFAESNDIALDYALFNPKDPVVDPITTLSYTSLLAAQVDAVYFALEAMGHSELSVLISESGWPTKGDTDESVANVQNAATYNNNLLMLVQNNTGTPRRPGQPLNVYIFSLFNEDEKTGKESERNWGVFNVDLTSIYYLDIEGSQAGAPQSFNGTGATWCIASPAASNESLEAGLNFACGEGNADCGPIQPGNVCYLPNTYRSHASWAYNSYYQRSGDNNAACDFGGSAMITATDPSYGSCIYPADALSPSGNVYVNNSTRCQSNSTKIILIIFLLVFAL